MSGENVLTILFRGVLRVSVILLTFILSIILFPPLVALFSPVYIFRFLLIKLAPWFRPDIGKIVATRSAILAVDKIYENPKLNMVFCGEVVGDVDVETFRRAALDNVINATREGGSTAWPEMQQYITSWMGFFFWKFDPTFDIKNHIKYYPECSKNEIIDDRRLLSIQKELLRQPFPRRRSPWEIIVIRNFRVRSRTILALRCHHAVADGFSVFKTGLKVLGISENLSRAREPRVRNPIMRVCRGISVFFSAPYELLEHLVRSVDNNEWHRPGLKMTSEYSCGVLEPIPMKYLKEITTMHKVSMSGLIMAAIAGGIRNFMLQEGIKVPEKIHCGIPWPVPNHPDKLRNHWAGVYVRLWTGINEPVERLKALEKEMCELRDSSVPWSIFNLFPLAGALFPSLIKPFTENYMATAVVSSFPGPTQSLSFVGHECVNMEIGGGLWSGTAIGFTALSYNGRVQIVGGADKAIISTDALVQEILHFVMKEFQALRGNDPDVV